jgi:hypothetical protein
VITSLIRIKSGEGHRHPLSILARALRQACKLTGVGKKQLLLISPTPYDRPPEQEPLQ